MVNIETWTETAMPRIPISNPDSRVTCDVDFNKDSLRLVAISKTHCGDYCYYESDKITVMYSYDFESRQWSQKPTNLKYFGVVRIVNGIRYFFNILNPERHFGYYYNAKVDSWIQLTTPGYYGQELNVTWEVVENVIAVPYYV